jgi:geranylgeranyl diphosphate synthase, type II
MPLEAFLARWRPRIEASLESLLPPAEGAAARVAEAMRYAVLGGGKRLRPVLAIAACEAAGGDPEDVLFPAAAIELIHTYSLLHDDLPAMDNDDLRRGRPTTHVVYGEAEAILAGDALLTLAFEILATRPQGESRASRRAESVRLVAARAGIAGMVGGQAADLAAEGASATPESVEWIHRHKTGALLSACAELGAVHAGATEAVRDALRRYADSLGLAFQVADDILDETSGSDTLGKTPGKDLAAGKATYPAFLGLDGARTEAGRLAEAALRELAALPRPPPVLEALARFAVSRTH